MKRADDLAVGHREERGVQLPVRGTFLDVDGRLAGDPVAFLRDCGEQKRERETIVVTGRTDLEPRSGHPVILARSKRPGREEKRLSERNDVSCLVTSRVQS